MSFPVSGDFLNWKHLTISHLQISPPKTRPFLQENGSLREIILHFFLRFFCFLGFFPLQAIAFQPQAAFQPLPKKSCQKHYRRFYVCSRMCLNGVVKVEMTGRNVGCQGWTVAKRRPALPPRLGSSNDSSAFGHGRASTPCAPAPVCTAPESGAGARALQILSGMFLFRIKMKNPCEKWPAQSDG
jgi:hypothetical protein